MSKTKPELIRYTARSVAADMRKQYSGNPTYYVDILAALDALPDNASLDQIIQAGHGDMLLGAMYRCSACDRWASELVQVGEPPDYESATAMLCRDCVLEALALFSAGEALTA